MTVIFIKNTCRLVLCLIISNSIKIFERFYPGSQLIKTTIASNPSKNTIEIYKTLEGKKQLFQAYLEIRRKFDLPHPDAKSLYTEIKEPQLMEQILPQKQINNKFMMQKLISYFLDKKVSIYEKLEFSMYSISKEKVLNNFVNHNKNHN